ncbi:TlpA family protein disulfide reductase [Kaarinaea lacus]
MKYTNLLAPILFLCNLTAAAEQLTLPAGVIVLEKRAAPELKLKDMDGEAFDLRHSKGKWTFVHFWATWCGPCRKEMPTIQAMSSELNDHNLEIVLVNTAEDDDTVFSFLGIVAPDLNPLMDKDGLVTERWQPRGLPSTYIVDPEGMLRYLVLGGRPWDKPAYIQFLKNISTVKSSNNN